MWRTMAPDAWQAYKQTGDPQLRERLILNYAPLVKYVAGRIGAALPPHVDQADLVSCGIFGLIDAIEKFDVGREIKFETYAVSRIRGAIIDELRQIDWIPRSVRHKARAVDKAYALLEARLQRSPTDADLADELGISAQDLAALFRTLTFSNVLALDELLTSDQGDTASIGDLLADTTAEDPGAAYEAEQTKHQLAQAIGTLSERERIVITLYYYEGITLADIGQVLGVTESRICQMHTRAVLDLRAALEGEDLPWPAR